MKLDTTGKRLVCTALPALAALLMGCGAEATPERAIDGSLIVADDHEAASGTMSETTREATSELTSACVTIRRGALGSVADTQIASDPDKQSKNWGSGLALNTGKIAAGTRETLVRFDLSAVPAHTSIVSATLTLTARLANTAKVNAHRVLVPWSEGATTYASFHAAAKPYQAAVAASAASTAGAMEFDVTSLVKAWDGGAPNHGVLLEQTGFYFTNFSASEDEDAASRPALEVCYEVDLCAGVVCQAADSCHSAGTCDPATGQCSNPAKPDGSACDDGDACTPSDTCAAGACVGSGDTCSCVNAKSGSATFNATGSGDNGSIQVFTVPKGVCSITMEAFGAQGGAAAAGGNTRGARMKGTFSVTPGQQLFILVGQRGSGGGSQLWGGGGTFVVDAANKPLLVAGGGGSCFSTCPAASETMGRITTSGGTAGATPRADNGAGGNVANTTSGAGAGFFGNGANASGGKSFLNGGFGGFGETRGGFGGGGGRTGAWGQGGGGGYSGGSCGDLASAWFGCGGGGSLNLGTNQDNTPGVRTGHGAVVITW